MIKDHFMRILPARKTVNPIIKAYVISEAFLWSGWNLVIPIAALFVTYNIPGGTIQAAATGYSIYLIARVLFELISGKFLARSTDKQKLTAAALGVLFASISLFSFAYTTTVSAFFLSYLIGGIGIGIGSPAKNALFSIHIDKNRETTEWGVADGITFISMALATTLGGFIAAQFGFKMLFSIAGAVSLLGTIPYLLNAVDTFTIT